MEVIHFCLDRALANLTWFSGKYRDDTFILWLHGIDYLFEF